MILPATGVMQSDRMVAHRLRLGHIDDKLSLAQINLMKLDSIRRGPVVGGGRLLDLLCVKHRRPSLLLTIGLIGRISALLGMRGRGR